MLQLQFYFYNYNCNAVAVLYHNANIVVNLRIWIISDPGIALVSSDMTDVTVGSGFGVE